MSICVDSSVAAKQKHPSLVRRLENFVSETLGRRHAVNDLNRLSDERLRDIGVNRFDISRRVDVEMAKVSRSGIGVGRSYRL